MRTVTGLLRSTREAGDTRTHLARAMEWLARAQDAADGGGVSYGFGIFEGWWPPYPETTGYCIPTFLRYARLTGEERFTARARAMASWELTVQRPDGGIPGGPIGRANAAAVPFDTGQVLQGLVAMYQDTREVEWLAAANRAGTWLVDALGADGTWSDRVPGGPPLPRSYNARTAWALLELDTISSRPDCREAAVRNIEWTLDCQRGNGWFAHCAFVPGEPPLTHTIAYVLEGLIGASQHLREPSILDRVVRTADVLHSLFRQRDWLAATFDESWRSQSRYSCVTGCAQTALVWWKLARLIKRRDLAQAALDMNMWLKTVQLDVPGVPGLGGGIPGSSPIFGGYEPLRLPNWAAKFFADALLAEIAAEPANAGDEGMAW